MSSLHTSDLTRRIHDYLSRRQPPKAFAADDQRKADQIAAYVAIVRRFAPQGDKLNDWWGKFLSTLSETSETWAWPTEGDLVKACKIIAKDMPRSDGPKFEIDPLAVAEKRIENDEPIGDNWLWGKNALALISRVGVDAILKRRDRFVAYAVEVYGEGPARDLIRSYEDRHQEAIKASEDRRVSHFNVVPQTKIKSVRDLLGPGPQYVPYLPGAAE